LDELFEEPLEFYDGHLTVPTKPGLGLVLREGALDEGALIGKAS